MNPEDVGRLWWTAMDSFGKAEGHGLSPAQEARAWMLVFFTAKRLLRFVRKKHGRFPKPPGLEEMMEVASGHL